MQEVTAGIRFLAECGVQRLILTNAAGCLNPEFAPGEWMMIADHLNLTGTSPLIGSPRFLDMSEVYSRRLREHFATGARDEKFTLRRACMPGVIGPQYETPAEIRMLAKLGADAVGMSTVLEAIEARALGLEVAGFSCLSNWAAGISGEPLAHDGSAPCRKARSRSDSAPFWSGRYEPGAINYSISANAVRDPSSSQCLVP